MYNFQTFGCSNDESSPNFSCHFLNHKVRVFQILHHCSTRRDNSSVFFQLKPHILWTKTAHQSEIFGLLSGWVKIHQIPHVTFETTSRFSLNFASLFNIMRDDSSVLFQLKRYMIFTKEAHQSAKFQNFDCSGEISPDLYFGRLKVQNFS